MWECPNVIIVGNPAAMAAQLAAGHHFACPWDGCAGSLGPWGSARTRSVRQRGGGTISFTPRRVICRACERTQVLFPTVACPRRADSVVTVWEAIALAANGAGHRTAAAEVGVPPTTVRGWLRRARSNAGNLCANATTALYWLDGGASKVVPTGSVLGDLLEVVGRAVMAWGQLHGDRPDEVPRLERAFLLTGGELLMPNAIRQDFWSSG